MTPPNPPTTDLVVLHALRCGGHAGIDRVAAATGLDEADVEDELIGLAVTGLVARGAWGVWGLTESGRAADASRIAADLDQREARSVVTAAYDRFTVLNPELLDLCTAWQVRSVDGAVTTNDHGDAGYDARVLSRFVELDGRAATICAELTAAVPRFACYRTRLAAALKRAAAGELDYLADNTSSYHAVWAELHEDLLATLGLRRW